MNNLAIAGLGTASVKNPFKWTGTGNGAVLGGSPPKAKWLEVWNQRLFLVPYDNRNRIYWSKLGDSEDHTTTGVAGSGFLEIGYNSGDLITGIWAHRERLFIFMRNRIYVVITANPNTDPTLWRLELLEKEGGCLSGLSIQTFNNDVIFMSDHGFVSLNILAGGFADFSHAIISKGMKVKGEVEASSDFEAIPFASVVRQDRHQYWCVGNSGVDERYAGAVFNDIFVLDFTPDNNPRWTRFRISMGIDLPVAQYSGYDPEYQQWIAPLSFGLIEVSGLQRILIGSQFYDVKKFNDTGQAEFPYHLFPNLAISAREKYMDAWIPGTRLTGKIVRRVESRAFDQGLPMQEKRYRQIGLSIGLADDTQTAAMDVRWKFDEDADKTGAVTVVFNGDDEQNQKTQIAVGGYGSGTGQRGTSMSIEIVDLTVGDGVTIKDITVDAMPLTQKFIERNGTISQYGFVAPAPGDTGTSTLPVTWNWSNVLQSLQETRKIRRLIASDTKRGNKSQIFTGA